MLGEIAIIALSILNQFSLINAGQNRDVFLGQFIGFNDLQKVVAINGSGWDFYNKNLSHESKLEILPQKIKSSDPDVNAVSAFAMDAGTDYPLFDKNSKKKMPIASLTKIMTAIVVLENSKSDEIVTISPKAMGVFGDKAGMVAGEKIKLRDLLQVMLIDSNNAAAYALAEHTGGGSIDNFVSLMNKKAEVLGLKDTKFFNPNGLDAPAGSENYSTAYDLAQLTDYALSKSSIWEISRTQEATLYSLDKSQTHHVKNTDELLGQMDNVYGGKTGYTTDAGECLVLISESPGTKHKIISVVLNAEDRFAETKKLVDWVFNSYRW
jgi:D-alanyl-D-alanine carboxypeptidase